MLILTGRHIVIYPTPAILMAQGLLGGGEMDVRVPLCNSSVPLAFVYFLNANSKPRKTTGLGLTMYYSKAEFIHGFNGGW